VRSKRPEQVSPRQCAASPQRYGEPVSKRHLQQLESFRSQGHRRLTRAFCLHSEKRTLTVKLYILWYRENSKYFPWLVAAYPCEGVAGLQSHSMSAFLCRGFLIWVTLVFAASAESGPVLKSYDQPIYPPIARAARVEGSVVVEFLLDEQGKPISISTVTGNPMLTNAAESFIKTWKFDLGSEASDAKSRYRTTIHFKLSHGISDPRDGSNLTVRKDSDRSFEVTALIGLTSRNGVLRTLRRAQCI
jgi:TonB family protein